MQNRLIFAGACSQAMAQAKTWKVKLESIEERVNVLT